jgi:hypothetical protein
MPGRRLGIFLDSLKRKRPDADTPGRHYTPAKSVM